MPKRRLSIRSMFYLAIFVALVATVGAYRALQASKPQPEQRTRRVVVAAADISEGSTIKLDALKIAELPSAAVAPNAFTVTDSLVGRITRVPIFAGDVIVPGRLAPKGSGPGLEVKISPGMRAMAVKVDDVAGLSGLINPGSHVDVLVTLTPEANGRRVSKLFMENVRVLSVGSVVQRDNSGKPIEASTATLEVDPAQAERLAVAMNQGTIQLVLRGYGDPAQITTAGASSSDVLSQLRNAPERVEPAPEKPRSEVRHSAPARVQAPAVAPPPVTPVPAAPKAQSETAVVRIYRGGGEGVEKKVEKADSLKHKPRGSR
ncbi:MAG TPA: Flp pilus assembly protein CpaB [Gemmatimonadaceae bacterium]|nr:Flp pilus assembly protein CpaB [Gemmatimonadaceae bacterium]